MVDEELHAFRKSYYSCICSKHAIISIYLRFLLCSDENEQEHRRKKSEKYAPSICPASSQNFFNSGPSGPEPKLLLHLKLIPYHISDYLPLPQIFGKWTLAQLAQCPNCRERYNQSTYYFLETFSTMIANRVLRSTRLCTAACSQGGSRPALGAPIFRASSSDAELHTTGSSNTAPAASSSNQMHSSRTAHRNVPDAAANAKDGAVWSDGRWVSSGAHASSSVDNQDLPKSASPKKSPPPSSSPTTSHSSESPIPLVANSMLEMTLRGRASRAVKENKIEEAMDSWRQLQARSLHLDTDVVVKMLHMCVSQGAMKGRKSNAHRMARVRREGDNSQTDYARAFQLFDGLVASGVRPPPEAFNLVSKAFGDAGNARYAAKVEQVMNAQREADSSAPRPSPLFTSNVITAHCRAGSLHMAAPLYEQMKAEGLRGTAAMYSAVAAAFASRGFPEFAAGCIGDMMGHAFVPPVSLCAAVVEAAAVKGDAKTLTLAVGWLSAHGGAMDRGTCQVCFDVAARACNPRLAAQVSDEWQTCKGCRHSFMTERTRKFVVRIHRTFFAHFFRK